MNLGSKAPESMEIIPCENPQKSPPEAKPRNQSKPVALDEKLIRRKLRREFRKGRSRSDAFTNVRRQIGQRSVPLPLIEHWLQEFSSSIGGPFNLGSSHPHAKQLLLLCVDEQQRSRNEIARWPAGSVHDIKFATERYALGVQFSDNKITAIVMYDNFHQKRK
jgi:hypothetical protein